VATALKQEVRHVTMAIPMTMMDATPTAPLSKTDTHAQNLGTVTNLNVLRGAETVLGVAVRSVMTETFNQVTGVRVLAPWNADMSVCSSLTLCPISVLRIVETARLLEVRSAMTEILLIMMDAVLLVKSKMGTRATPLPVVRRPV
jgi:hypothetical protein